MIPSNVVVHQQSKVLELSYEGGATYRLPVELLRVLSPSAEVQGHGPGQETLQTGKATMHSSPAFLTDMILVCLPGIIYCFCVKTRSNCGKSI